MRERYATMSDEAKEASKTRLRQFYAKRRATMSDETKEAEKTRLRQVHAKRRATMSDETKEAEKTRLRQVYDKRRATMSDDMKQATKKQKREDEAKQRATMSDDMTEATKIKKREYSAKRRAASKLSDEASRVNFSNLTEEVLSAVAMEPGDGVKLHFKNHIDCPEANACLNHLSTHRNHFIDDPTTVQGRERLKQKIRGQYISPEKQKEVAKRFLAPQGRGCK